MTTPKHDAEAKIARHYAEQQKGLPPPLDPHPGFATLGEAWVAGRRYFREKYPLSNLPAPPPVRPD